MAVRPEVLDARLSGGRLPGVRLGAADLVSHGQECATPVRERTECPLQTTAGAAAVVRRGVVRRPLPACRATTRKPVDTCAGEGACRYLVRDRMKLTGARWRLVGADAILELRALRASGDFDAYRDFHETREYERNHARRYADGL